MNIEPTIAQVAANCIRDYNPRLADLFMAQPFNRVTIAKAFAAGFANDVHNVGASVITCAEMDRDQRADEAA